MKQYVFSASGRTEISGNHTDHQHGCVLAASVNLRTTAQVALNDSNMIHIRSEGYPTSVKLLIQNINQLITELIVKKLL